MPGAWIIFHSSDASLPKNLVMVVSPPEPQKYGKITLMGNFRKIILTWWISCWILTIHIAEGFCMTMIIFNSASTLFLSSPYWTSFNARLPNLVQNNLFWGKTCQHCSLWFYIDLFLCWIINANHACLQKTFKNNHTHTHNPCRMTVSWHIHIHTMHICLYSCIYSMGKCAANLKKVKVQLEIPQHGNDDLQIPATRLEGNN